MPTIPSQMAPTLHWGAWRIVEPTSTNEGGEWSRVACPNCGSHAGSVKPSVYLHQHGRFVCVRCGHNGHLAITPEHYRDGLAGALSGPNWWEDPSGQGDILAHAAADLGVSVELLLAQGAGVAEACYRGADSERWFESICVPCRATEDGPIVDVLAFSFDDNDNLIQTRIPGGTQAPWGWETVQASEAIIVQDPRDRLAMLAAGIESVACIPERMHPRQVDGGDWRGLTVMEVAVKRLSKVVLAFADNEPGHRIEEELARRIGADRCWRIRWKELSYAQAHELARAEGSNTLAGAIENATAFPVAGLHELHDVEDELEVLYEFGLQPGCSTDWPSVDQHYTVVPGQWTLVTGIPSHGKSTWMDALLVNLAKRHGWKFGLFSPENQPIVRHYASLMEKYVGAPFSEGPTPRITPSQKDEAKRWLNQHFKVILPDEDAGAWTLDHVLGLAKMLVYRHGIRGLVIDPWNELDNSRPGGMSETEFISLCLTKIRRFARLHRVHVWVVAHPTKMQPKDDGYYPVPTPYDVSGGAHWRNKADNSICIYRYVGKEDEDVTDVHIQKVRFKEVGRVGLVSLRCEVITGRFFDDIDQEKRKAYADSNQHVSSASLRCTPRKRHGSEIGIPVHVGDPIFN